MRRHRPLLTNCPYCNIDLSVFSHPQRHIGQCCNRNIATGPVRVFGVEVARPPSHVNPPPLPVAAGPAFTGHIDSLHNVNNIPHQDGPMVPQEFHVEQEVNPIGATPDDAGPVQNDSIADNVNETEQSGQF